MDLDSAAFERAGETCRSPFRQRAGSQRRFAVHAASFGAAHRGHDRRQRVAGQRVREDAREHRVAERHVLGAVGEACRSRSLPSARRFATAVWYWHNILRGRAPVITRRSTESEALMAIAYRGRWVTARLGPTRDHVYWYLLLNGFAGKIRAAPPL